MVLATQAAALPSGQFTSSGLLKLIQEVGSSLLFVEQSSLDSVLVRKGAEWKGGKIRTFNLTLDPGGAAFGGMQFNSGRFLPGDYSTYLTAYLQPKFQTSTMLYQRFLDSFTKDEMSAYINHLKSETSNKASAFKSLSNTWLLGDGTGRIGTPIGLGASNAASGASFTIADPATPLKIKLSTAKGAVGNAVNFYEGMVVSFLYPDYDPNNDGTESTTYTDCDVRYLTLEFVAGSTKSYYDAFRVVKVDVRDDAIYLVPCRESAPAAGSYAPTSSYAPNEAYVQKQGSTTMWCAGSGTVTVKPYHGMTTANAIATTLTAIPDLAVLFDPVTQFANAATLKGFYIVPTHHVPSGTVDYGYNNNDFSTYTSVSKTNAEIARLMLGFGWTSSTAVDLINPFVPTGIQSLLVNQANTINGINRASTPQINSTSYDTGNRPLSFNEMFKFITDHANRNKNLIPEWNVLLMGTLAYESMIGQSELDRRITEQKGIRGEDSAKTIRINGKLFQLDSHEAMRNDFIYSLPKGMIEQHGGKPTPVSVGGQSEFLSLASGRRINTVESYNTIVMEYCLRIPRAAAFMQNFNLV